MEAITTGVTFLHVVAGGISLFTAMVAILSKIIDMKHKWHIYSGIVYTICMTLVFVTALILVFVRTNLFLFLIAIFSFYLTFKGWRYAKNRKGNAERIDWVSSFIMAIAGVGMMAYGAYMLLLGFSDGVILLVFGGFSCFLSYMDIQTLRRGPVKGKNRIANHLGMMLGASLTTFTAFMTTNIQIEPGFIVWLTPAFIFTPMIFWWTNRLNKGYKPKGMPKK